MSAASAVQPRRFVLWGINYAPEETGIAPYNADLARYLAGQGHDVTALVAIPYYPQWAVAPAWRGRWSDRRVEEGVKVHRLRLYVPPRPTTIRRLLHELSFTTHGFLRLLFGRRPDLLIVVSPPLFLGAAARVLRALRGVRYHLHVQDMQPDAAIQMGFLRPGRVARMLYALERFAYRGAHRLSGITPGMVDLFRAKGLADDCLLLVPNWIRQAAIEPAGGDQFRARHGIPVDSFCAIYSGNLGRKQGLDILLDAAVLLERGDVTVPPGADPAELHLVIAGDGGEKENLAQAVRDRDLQRVHLLPLQPAEAFPALLDASDLALVTQRPGSGSLFFPSKLLTLAAAGRALLVVADEASELATVSAEAGFAARVPTGDPVGLAATLLQLQADPQRRASLAARGRGWVAAYTREAVLRAFADELMTAAR